jgi:poly-gamma-glutamate capsule biosynthesis protein CapA/YwtB (metallophosphatase superfamily)
MLAGLSRWVREEAPARLVPTRLRKPIERWTAAHAYPASPTPLRWTISREPAEATLLLGGDLALHRWPAGQSPATVLSGLAALTRSADALILNLETQLTARSAPSGTIGSSLRADPAAVEVLSYLGVKAVTCANNHCLDYGPDGLGDSVERLTQAGIRVSGVVAEGRDGGSVLSAGGIRVGLLGFSDDWRVGEEDPANGFRPAPHDPVLVRERIAAMRSTADLVVVQLHWGYEWSMYPMLTLRDLARSYVDAGAGLVVCHHAHVPMGVEPWGKGGIAHGLGNFYFGPPTRDHHPFGHCSFALRAEISRAGIVALEVLPVTTDAEGRPGPDAGRSAAATLNAIARLSSRLGDSPYLARVEFSLLARHGCALLLDIGRRLRAGEDSGVAERIRFLGAPRQRALMAGLSGSGGMLGRIGDVLQHLREGRMEHAELSGLARWAGRYLARHPQLGRIP